MSDSNDKIQILQNKLEILSQRQEMFSKEIQDLKAELHLLIELQVMEQFGEIKEQEVVPQTTAVEIKTPAVLVESVVPITPETPVVPVVPTNTKPQVVTPAAGKSDLEKFIGENLINKIGIAITIIGVAIGAKYSIDHDLISPLTRIILGYFVGLGLMAFGIKLKAKYDNFSGVLVSGAIAILYFITYAAHAFYGLFPQSIAFVLMVVFTGFTVVAAHNYNKQVIAIIGLVGAYAVPLLLSDGSGQILVLFSYMAIINIGILIIAYKKYWKLLYYSSFILTWIIFSSWFFNFYRDANHFGLAPIFSILFFVIFYSVFLVYKLVQKEKFGLLDILFLLANSFIFFGFGYYMLTMHKGGFEIVGLFTAANGVIHFVVGLIIYRMKLVDKNLFYFIVGLVLVFITATIPVQLNGNWVTLLWVLEAAILFWIGRTKEVKIYEILSYPLMVLAVFSLIQDWTQGSFSWADNKSQWLPMLNIRFFSTILFAMAFGIMLYFNRIPKYKSALSDQKELNGILNFFIPSILVLTIYVAFLNEIETYWSLQFDASMLKVNNAEGYPGGYNGFYNFDLLSFKEIWKLNYTMLFCSVLTFLNIKYIKQRNLAFINIILNTLALAIFLTQGLLLISNLRDSYLNPPANNYYKLSNFHILIRYITLAFAALLLWVSALNQRQDFLKPKSKNLKVIFDSVFYAALLWIASSELIHWMDMTGNKDSYKLGLSILWGISALLFISFGIWKKKKHLRIGAIILFSITLLKLFLYDISALNTISKTIVFVVLGILLLIISFLYNKYKHIISPDDAKEN